MKIETKADFHSPSRFRTILRYQIDPQWESEARLEELLRFCAAARVDEVMLLMQAEELSPGHPTADEMDEWCGLAVRVGERLRQEGIGLSLNPWATTYAVTRGRTMRPGHHFQRMVGENGKEHPLAACPLCPEWQAMIAGNFARMAREIRPLAIWIEDDWRLHNHGALLGWGGCFCPLHLQRFSALVGESVTRQQVLESVLRGGPPHPWRKLWLELSRDSLLEPARVIRDAVRSANPDVRLGLMSSMPDQHSIEGRDWDALREAFGMEEGWLIRPHMPPYTQQWTLRVNPWPLRHTLAFLEGPVTCYPELENSPRNGPFTKSGRATALQILEAAAMGSPGITINHFDNMGTGIALDPQFAGHLAHVLPQADALTALGLDDRQADGVQVLVAPDIAAAMELSNEGVKPLTDADAAALNMALQTMSGTATGAVRGSMQALAHPSMIWSETLAILSIAHRVTKRIEPGRGPIFLSGQTHRAFSDEEVRRLLSGSVVLDALAVEGLIERGFGAHLGIEAMDWLGLEASGYSYEQLTDAAPGSYAVTHPRMTAQRCAGKAARYRGADELQVLSTLHRADRSEVCAGVVQFGNALGGCITSLCYPLDGGAQFFMGFFSVFRQQFLWNIVMQDARGAGLLLGPVGTRCYRQTLPDGTLFLAVLNVSDDDIHEPALKLGGCGSQWEVGWQMLDEGGGWLEAPVASAGDTLQVTTTIQPLRGLFLRRSG